MFLNINSYLGTLPPFFVLGLEPSQHKRHSHDRIALQSVNDVRRLVTVDPLDGALVDCGRRSTERVIQAVAGGLLRGHATHLLLDALQNLDGVLIRLQNDVELESLVLSPVDELFVLSLP